MTAQLQQLSSRLRIAMHHKCSTPQLGTILQLQCVQLGRPLANR